MKNLAKLTTALFVLFTLTACNTVAGVGKDVSKVGDALEKSAEKAKK